MASMAMSNNQSVYIYIYTHVCNHYLVGIIIYNMVVKKYEQQPVQHSPPQICPKKRGHFEWRDSTFVRGSWRASEKNMSMSIATCHIATPHFKRLKSPATGQII